MKINIGQKFLKIVKKCFPKDHPLHKICNRSTIKISQSRMKNIKAIIEGENKREINKEKEGNKTDNKESKICDCRIEQNGPMDGECIQSGVIYTRLR